MPFSALDYLCIGHCCHDRVGERHVLGGTASYSGLVAQRLGLRTGILSSVGADFEFAEVFEKQGIAWWNKPAAETTVFENIYRGSERVQYLHRRAATLFAEDVPEACRDAAIVLFCPIAAEVDFSVMDVFPGALRGATIQGWLRRWDAAGRVSPVAMDWSRLAGADVIIMSDADIRGFEDAVPLIADTVEVLVMTQGALGAQVWRRGEKHFFPAFPVTEVDATGAGDVFATAFLLKYAQTRDIASAAVFAHCAASFVVEGTGIDNLAMLDRIDRRVGEYAARTGFVPAL